MVRGRTCFIIGVIYFCFYKFVVTNFQMLIMTIQQYIESINSRYKSGLSTEHTYRGDLQQLIESILPDVKATNEPKRQACGAPDYIITRKDIPIGYIEAKDIGDPDLDGKRKAETKSNLTVIKPLYSILFLPTISIFIYTETASL